MRRLVLVSALVALAALAGATGAGAAKPRAGVVVRKGSAHAVGGELRGWFVVVNQGDAVSARSHGAVQIRWAPTSAGGRASSRVLAKSAIAGPGIRPLASHRWTRIQISAQIPRRVAAGDWPVFACADDCRQIGSAAIGETTAGAGRSGGSSAPGGAGGSPPPASLPISTVPTDPIPYVAGTPFEVSGGGDYWAFVPDSYDASNLTPTPLLVWLHGCGGESSGDIWVVDPGAEEEPQDWLTIAVGGREGECWTPSVDEVKVMAALTDLETHFNVDRRRVILGGYSSGGDLAYRTGFRHSATFAGLLIENSTPFRDTESSQAESLAAATTKLHIVALAHLQDTTYKIGEVRQEVGAVEAAGFPIELIERPGRHYDAATDTDLRTLLLPHIDDGWPAPAS